MLLGQDNSNMNAMIVNYIQSGETKLWSSHNVLKNKR